MPFAMRAIKTFSGRAGESRRPENLVEMGDDINVADKRRADYLERRGFAAPLIRPRAKVQATIENKAAQSGPLPSAGGETGAASAAPSSSPPARVPRQRTSKPRGEKLDL